MIFSSEKIIPGKNINNIDIAKTIGTEEQLCIPNVKEKISLIIKKDYGEALVTIAKQ